VESQTSSGVWVPSEFSSRTEGRGAVEQSLAPGSIPGGPGDVATVVNETDLPDEMILNAARDHFVENASMAWGQTTNFQMYANQQGSLLARADYKTPTNVIEEIKLARDLAERDDDVRSVIGSMVALAFGEGMENFHQDEQTVSLFNAVARNMNLDGVLKEMYREYLIAAQFTTVSLFTRSMLDYTPLGTERVVSKSVASPLVGVLHSENVRVIGNDLFGTAVLAYDPPDERLRAWLDEFFNPNTTPARKAEMGRQDRVAATMFTGKIDVDPLSAAEDQPFSWLSTTLFKLNPRMCHRTTMPKGAWKYPRPILTADFSLLEAKRLLNIMDFALLQGGANFVVVAKKGSDARPALPEEVTNLREVVKNASKTGVIVGDHRLTFEIITPKLDELLNAGKRRLLGKKIAMAMMRTPEHGDEEGNQETAAVDIEITARVITADRRDIQRHVEGNVYTEIVRRNPQVFTKGAAKLWFPKIVLQGLQYFTDLVLKLRDRGDIPRSWATSVAGFPWEAAVQVRKQEIARGDDDIMEPASVPHSSPQAGPQDNNNGRPAGVGDGQTSNDPARPKRTINRNPGETIKAWYEDEAEQVIRMGDITYAILEEHADSQSPGRVQTIEREAIDSGEVLKRGMVTVVPVNQHEDLHELKAIRLRDGLSMIVGQRRGDEAFLAAAISFRDTDFSDGEVETAVAKWGFGVRTIESGPEVAEEQGKIELHIHQADGETARMLIRDEDGNIIGSAPAKDPEQES
jgi:hypothetical protein